MAHGGPGPVRPAVPDARVGPRLLSAWSMKLIALAVLLATVTPAAAQSPHQWFILWGTDNQCHPATQVAPQAPSPEKLHFLARAAGRLDDIKVGKDVAGNVLYVTTKIGGIDGIVVWFPDAQKCEVGKKRMIQGGDIPDMTDLE